MSKFQINDDQFFSTSVHEIRHGNTHCSRRLERQMLPVPGPGAVAEAQVWQGGSPQASLLGVWTASPLCVPTCRPSVCDCVLISAYEDTVTLH